MHAAGLLRPHLRVLSSASGFPAGIRSAIAWLRKLPPSPARSPRVRSDPKQRGPADYEEHSSVRNEPIPRGMILMGAFLESFFSICFFSWALF